MNTLRCYARLAILLVSVGANALDGVQGEERQKSVEPVATDPLAMESASIDSVGMEPVIVQPGAVEPVTVDPMAMKFVPAKPVIKMKFEIRDLSSTQILCVDQRREGSRIRETKCQSLAEWRSDNNMRKMRAGSMLRPPGKSASWE